MLTAVFLIAAALPQEPPAARHTITTRVPQAHLDAYMTKCAANAPRATCWCVVEKLNATADGQFVLDMLGVGPLNDANAKAKVMAAVNRHGLRASQAQAAITRSDAMLADAAKACA